MRDIVRSNQFKRDYKQAIKRGYKINKLTDVLLLLSNDQPLPPKNKNHKLSSN
ncbi:MAG: hypothetical protein DRQ51_01950 [Gammaproteobacteria bacterium]|nr:MAG: hypothetical protein DRQ51_01950 [Gammaproteobacteria bacterium]